jgi:p-hydroxybenzoate 3-monooxygenase
VLRTDVPIIFNAEAVALTELDGTTATLHYRDASGNDRRIQADFIIGCDGFHGVSRNSVPAGSITLYEHAYPFCWLGVLAQSAPVSNELIYTNHERGFALVSMRSPAITRLYVQCPAGDELDAWPDHRFWRELRLRLDSSAGGPAVGEGTILQKGITPMRSFVAEPMRFGRLFLAGDAAHIVPPTGAKGMNLALADVRVLGRALEQFYMQGDAGGLDAYSQTCLRRVWKTQRFSAWMTGLLHHFDTYGAFERRLQLAELDYVTSSRAAARSLAENYVGLPFDESGPGLDDAGTTSRP